MARRKDDSEGVMDVGASPYQLREIHGAAERKEAIAELVGVAESIASAAKNTSYSDCGEIAQGVANAIRAKKKSIRLYEGLRDLGSHPVGVISVYDDKEQELAILVESWGKPPNNRQYGGVNVLLHRKPKDGNNGRFDQIDMRVSTNSGDYLSVVEGWINGNDSSRGGGGFGYDYGLIGWENGVVSPNSYLSLGGLSSGADKEAILSVLNSGRLRVNTYHTTKVFTAETLGKATAQTRRPAGQRPSPAR